MTRDDWEDESARAQAYALMEVPKPRVVDDAAIQVVEAILAGMKAGRVTALAVVAKEDAYSRWTCSRAYTNADRYNLIGQLHSVIHDLLNLVEE